MKRIHHKTAKSTIMQLHIKTQAANKSWSYEEQTGHTPDGYVGIPNVHNGSLLQSYWREELVCKEKDKERKSELLRWPTVPGESISTAARRSREGVRLLSFCSCTCGLSCGHYGKSSVSAQVQQQRQKQTTAALNSASTKVTVIG